MRHHLPEPRARPVGDPALDGHGVEVAAAGHLHRRHHGPRLRAPGRQLREAHPGLAARAAAVLRSRQPPLNTQLVPELGAAF